jgi:hypothetical protein
MKLTQNQLIILRRRLDGRAKTPFLPRALVAVMGVLPGPLGKRVGLMLLGFMARSLARQGYSREDFDALLEVATKADEGRS